MDASYDRTHQLNWTYRVEQLSPLVQEVKLQGYWDKVDHLMDNHLRASMMSMSSKAKTQVYGVKASTSLAVGTGVLTSGIDYYNRNWDVMNSIPDVYVDNVGVFAEYDLSVAESLLLEGGLRGDLTWVEPTHSHTATPLPGSADFAEVGGNLQLTWKPTTGVELFTGIARGVRTPDPEELYIDRPYEPMMAMMEQEPWIGNPDLKPTKNYEADLGVKYASGRYFINASVFYSYLTDFINITSRPLSMKQNIMTYENVTATMWGSELGAQYALPADLFLKGSLSYVEGENRDGHRPLSEIPPLHGSIGARYDNGTAFVEVTENLSARQGRRDSVLQEQATASYATTELKAGYRYKAISLYAGINNMFDAYYHSYLSYQRNIYSTGVKVPENGRTFYVTIAYNL
jgi:iron complex outermembrane receptor protein